MNHNGFLMVIYLCVFSGEHILLILEGKDPQINMDLDFPPWSLRSSMTLKSHTYARITLRCFTWFMVCL